MDIIRLTIPFLCLVTRQIDGATVARGSFTAAVYEHDVQLPVLTSTPLSRSEALDQMMINIRIYEQQARLASQKGAVIIVFPEDGIYGMFFNGSRSQIFPFLEFIPDPSIHWSPCLEPGKYPDTEILTHLSCMAKNNSLYVVANMGDVQPCNGSLDPSCPGDGHYQFNTDVAFDSDGYLIARYHKYNLYYEFQFDSPDVYDVSTFDTSFGRFGIFTCFDILFENPPLALVEKYNVTNVLFPTAWMDAEPFLTSVQFHSSFAMAHGVNMLAANIHKPGYRFRGSGIYTPEGAAAYYYNASSGSDGRLIVATIPTIVGQPVNTQAETSTSTHSEDIVGKADRNNNQFSAQMFKDMHNLSPLDDLSGSASVCHNSLCCNVKYDPPHKADSLSQLSLGRRSVGSSNTGFFALAAYDGLHKNARYYMQICSIVKCNKTDTGYLCGKPIIDNVVVDIPGGIDIRNFTISGNFSAPYVYPQVLLQEGPSLRLTDYPRAWSYSNGRLSTEQPLDKQLHVASLLGRDYQRDLPN